MQRDNLALHLRHSEQTRRRPTYHADAHRGRILHASNAEVEPCTGLSNDQVSVRLKLHRCIKKKCLFWGALRFKWLINLFINLKLFILLVNVLFWNNSAAVAFAMSNHGKQLFRRGTRTYYYSLRISAFPILRTENIRLTFHILSITTENCFLRHIILATAFIKAHYFVSLNSQAASKLVSL